MSITENDVKVMASERLADTDDGGGQMSAVEVSDGVVNNLFPDISRLDRTYGRVNLRKAYAAVQTANKDSYYGAHAIITDGPEDPRVSTLLFTTDSYSDERTAAQDRIESYVVTGPESRMVLYGNQLEGTRTILAYQRTEEELPEVGQVYLLSTETDGVPSQQQYVRIKDLSHEVRTFVDDKGKFDRKVITMEINTPLRHTFESIDVPERKSAHGSPTLLRTTQVADAARYYGVVPMDEDIAPGDMTIKASTVYGQLVPSTQVEAPVTDVQAGSQNIVPQPAAPLEGGAVRVTGYDLPSGSYSAYYPRAVTPGTFLLRYVLQSNYWVEIEDDEAGNLVYTGRQQNMSASADTGDIVGSIEYDTGLFSVTDFTNFDGSQSWVEAVPAAPVADTAHTTSEFITLANRGYNYVKTLLPIPAPGTTIVDYMVMGRWYRMKDNGKGELSDTQGGTGTIDFTTGSITATLGALPDADSEVMYAWGSGFGVIQQTGESRSDGLEMRHTTSNPITPGTLVLSWEAGGGTKTATDDGAGYLTGDALGRVVYDKAGVGEIRMVPTLVPSAGASVAIDYDTANRQSLTVTPSGSSATETFDITGVGIKPGSLSMAFTKTTSVRRWGIHSGGNIDMPATYRTYYGAHEATLQDDGVGGIDGDSAGSVDYGTGVVTLTRAGGTEEPQDNGQPTITSWSIANDITFTWEEPSTVLTQQSETAAFGDLVIDLNPTSVLPIMPESIMFDWNGKTYVDRAGSIYTDIDPSTGSGTDVGSVDYTGGTVTLTTYSGGGDGSVTVKGMLARMGDLQTDTLVFRTPGAPLRPGSFYIRANKQDGTLLQATADMNGIIASGTMNGSVTYDTGVVALKFGAMVADAGLTAEEKEEWWYDATMVDDNGDIWKPDPILPSTAKFNAVVYSIMPLDADIIGLDPVRLPIDGRVPIIRSGDVVVVHSTASEDLSSPLSAGQTVSLSRNQLAACELKDQAGAAVDPALYTVDRTNGAITMADPLDLSAYTEPLVATHRIEAMALVNESQINGTISLVNSIDRSFSAADTYVSSALIFGDLASRVHHLFSQQTWTGAWSDERVGTPTTAQYNDILYPVQVNNLNSIKERWALVFTSSTTFNVVGEFSGVIDTGNTSADCAPINPITGEPYFTVLAAGWGSGWSTNNVLRFNTDAANYPMWIARTTISGAPTEQNDDFRIQIRGDAD